LKVLFHYDAGPRLRDELDRLRSQGLDIVCCPQGPAEPFLTELKDAEALWHVLEPVTAEIISQAPNLRLIQKIGVGVNTIDLEAAKAAGIAVCNMPGTNSRAVAEMTLLLMLSTLRRLPQTDALCRSGAWTPDDAMKESFSEVAGKTVGLIGFGSVPQILAPILEAMGATVIYTARSKRDVPYRYFTMPELLEQADILSLHIPFTGETDKLIGTDALSRMKRGAVLINTARGQLVDETALHAALVSGHLSGAGLDVFDEEPVSKASPLLDLPNVTLSPHLAWLTRETFDRSIEIAGQNSLASRDGGALVHRVA
jgi:phosphoglycerate dehydrogenase-like enzyme